MELYAVFENESDGCNYTSNTLRAVCLTEGDADKLKAKLKNENEDDDILFYVRKIGTNKILE